MRLVIFTVVLFVTACGGPPIFENRLDGRAYCNPELNGEWALSPDDIDRMGQDLGPPHSSLELYQSDNCVDSSLTWYGKDEDATYTIISDIAFVEIDGNIIAQLIVTSIDDGKNITNSKLGTVLFKIEVLKKSEIKAFTVSVVELIALIDERRIQGKYEPNAHGADVFVSDTGFKVAKHIENNDRFFSELFTLVKVESL